jgi:serine/threonine-protein kinase
MADDVFGIVGTTQAGSFRVDRAVAEGGFAVVYRAYHIGFRAHVALKCLKVPGSVSREEQKRFLTSFREEAELLFHLSAALPTVVRPLQVGMIESKVTQFVPFIALEWLEGAALDVMIAKRRERAEPPLRLGEAVTLLEPIADALERAHRFSAPEREKEVCIVHRDIKPDNIFIAEIHGQRVPKILDFGIAKVRSAASQVIGKPAQDQNELPAFTAAYGAPEQWVPMRFGQTGPWTDVWGLAITLAELVIGRCPVDGDHVAMMGIVTDPERRPTPRTEGVMITDAAEAVFQKALAVDPSNRYARVREFWTALTEAIDSPSTRAREQRMPEITSLVVPKASPSKSVGGMRAVAPQGSSGGSRPSDTSAFLVGHTVDGLGEGAAPTSRGLALDELQAIGVAPRGALARVGRARPITATTSTHGSKDYGGPVMLLLLGVLLMIADWGYARFTGEAFRMGPVRTLWIAGPLALLGMAQLLTRIVTGDD